MKKFDEESSNYTKTINKTLGDNSMHWKICCSNLGKQKITFQSFLNVLKLRESSGKEVKEREENCYNDTHEYQCLGFIEVFWKISGSKRAKIWRKDSIYETKLFSWNLFRGKKIT